MSRIGAHAALRAATSAIHERIDGIYSRADLSSPDHYAVFLTAQAVAFIPVEQALEQAGAIALLPDWQERKRSEALRADLLALGAPMPAPLPAPSLSSRSELWGALYVLEGSRLGGKKLRQMVAPGAPAAFLGASSPQGGWGKLIRKLNQMVVEPEEIVLATGAAQIVFGLFEQAGSLVFGASDAN